MSISQIDQLKNWFKTGERPTEQQFWNWLDSYVHINQHFGLNEYNPALSYEPGTACWHAGTIYVALATTTGTFSPSAWEVAQLANPVVIRNLQTQIDELKTLVYYLMTQV